MKVTIYLTVSLFLLASCASNNEYVVYQMGSDTFNSDEGVFERGICSGEQSQIVIHISLTKAQKAKLVDLAKQDIKIGNESVGDIDRICVSNSPHEISIMSGDTKVSSACLSLLNIEDNKFEDFIYALPEIRELPKSQCMSR